MNNTIKLRESIRGRTDSFTAEDCKIEKAGGILNKMLHDGEVEIAAYDKNSNGRPIKRYKIVKLREYRAEREKKVTVPRAEKVREIPLYAQLWALVYPDLFRIPDFSGFKQTIRVFKGD